MSARSTINTMDQFVKSYLEYKPGAKKLLMKSIFNKFVESPLKCLIPNDNDDIEHQKINRRWFSKKISSTIGQENVILEEFNGKYQEIVNNYVFADVSGIKPIDQEKLKQKDLFDKHHRASDKKISVVDQILIKQQKSTTKPQFRPQPLIFQEVKGNKVTATDGNITRKRDKNQVKVVPYRPAHLQSSVNCKSKPKTYNQQSTSYSSPIYHNEINQPTIQQDGNSESTRDNLFSLEPGATAELAELINTAEARLNESNNIQHENEGRVLRSQGLKLQWNRNMNDPNVVEHSQ